MKWYQEITVWADKTPNHVYLLNDSRTRMYAYVPAGSATPQEFKKPLQIDIRGRKFKLSEKTFDLRIKESGATKVFEAIGSRGETYCVTEDQGKWSCTCKGFQFRGHCRHITQFANQ